MNPGGNPAIRVYSEKPNFLPLFTSKGPHVPHSRQLRIEGARLILLKAFSKLMGNRYLLTRVLMGKSQTCFFAKLSTQKVHRSIRGTVERCSSLVSFCDGGASNAHSFRKSDILSLQKSICLIENILHFLSVFGRDRLLLIKYLG